MLTRLFTIGLILSAAISATTLAQNIRYVDDDAPAGGNGQTWATSYNDLQDALSEARSNSAITEIRIAGGAYSPGPDREDSFAMVNNVAIRGGYRGLSPGGDSDDRDIALFETILTGVTDPTDPWPDCVYNVFKHEEELILDETAVLDGVTITRGEAFGYFDFRGGAMFNDINCSPTIINCRFTENYAEHGGAIYNNRSNPVIINCVFENNLNDQEGGGCIKSLFSDITITGCTFNGNFGVYGGCINSVGGELTIAHCSFIRNRGVRGGAIYIVDCDAEVTSCAIRGNVATESGGGLVAYRGTEIIDNCVFESNLAQDGDGGGLYNYDGNTTVTRCVFRGNSAVEYGGSVCNRESCTFVAHGCSFYENNALKGGGAITNEAGNASVTNCKFNENATDDVGGGAVYNNNSDTEYTNCSFNGNKSRLLGGCFYNYESSPALTNCTIINSAASRGAAIYNISNSDPVLTNCILWHNVGEPGMQIYDSGTTTTVNYSCVEGGWTGNGNIDTDPLFFLSEDTHLTPGSPCIDSGTGNTPVALPAYDLDSNGRQLDGNGDTIAIVDMGAHEFRLDSPCIGVDTEKIIFLALENEDNLKEQTLFVYNCGAGVLSWRISGKPDWLTITPDNGQSTGESDEITLQVDATGLMRGEYAATLDVFDPQVSASPRKIDVTLYVGQLVPVEYSSIQWAIISAQPGDVIEVAPGRYRELEPFDLLGKAITLRSAEGPEKTILEGLNEYPVITCHSGEKENTIIDGFTIINGYAEYGAGMNNVFSSPTVRNCIFRENNALHSGGGMCNSINSSPKVINCVFKNNSVVYHGGAVCNFRGCSPVLTNCTFVGNSGSYSGGAIANFTDTNPIIENCIIWGNVSPNGMQIYDGKDGITRVTYSCIEDGWPGIGNIAEDPLFIFPDDHRLTSGSPCIDSGSGSSLQVLPISDIDSNARPLDGDLNGEPVMDMGAYEYNPYKPTVALEKEKIVFYAIVDGDNPNTQTISLINSGGGTLNWEITGQPDWLTVTPDAGTSDGEVVQVALNVEIDGLTRRTRYATFTVADPLSVNSYREIEVYLHLGYGTIHVPANYSSINAAVGNAIPGEIVEVAPGTYNGTINFYGKPITLRSTDGPAVTVIDGESEKRAIVCNSGEDSHTIIDGFTITNGYGFYGGGGMFNERSSPTVKNCIFRANRAYHGGGGAISNTFNSNPSIFDCRFEGNSGHNGGALENDIGCSPQFFDCLFLNNYANYSGGGMYNFVYSKPVLHNCEFRANRTKYGGALLNSSSDAEVVNCVFTGNTATEIGGAIVSSWGATKMLNCTFTSNSAGVDAGTIWNQNIVENEITNCIIQDSYSPTGNHIVDTEGSIVVARSCIQDGWPGDGNIDTDPVFVANPDDGGDGWGDDPDTTDVDESLNDDFGDLRLQAGSPCIDAGRNDAVPADLFDLDGDGDITEPVPFDLQGLLRFFDDPATLDTGVGVGPIVDMGAYEYHSTFVPGDCDSDGDLDRADLRKLAECTGGVNNDVAESCSCCDMDGDGDVDLIDYSLFQQNMTIPETGDGDCDDDGDVDSMDLQIFVGCQSVPGTPADEACLCSDLDGDGDVDLEDYRHLQRIVTDPYAGSADLDRDGDVDLGDFGIFQAFFGTLSGTSADLDDDGYVDIDDYLLLKQQFGGPQ